MIEKVKIDSLEMKMQSLNLAPLQEPDPVGFSFETIGWKILALLLFLIASWLLLAFINRYRKNKYRRDALNQLNNTPAEERLALGLVLLKSTAIAVYGREQVASLTGAAWLEFLDLKTRGKSNFSEYHRQLGGYIFDGQLPSEADRKKIVEQIQNWISSHHVSV